MLLGHHAPTEHLQLTIQQTNSNIVLSWPSNIVCRLLCHTNLSGNNANWTQIPTATNQIQISPTNGNAFYKLVTP